MPAWILLSIALLMTACSGTFASNSAACEQAGGRCRCGPCPDGGPSPFTGIDCNPERTPCGGTCCPR